MGAIYALAAFVYNIVADIWNAVAALVNFFVNAWKSPIAAIQILFYSLGEYIYTSFIVPTWNAIAAFINFFANVWHSPIAAVKILFLELSQSVVGIVFSMVKAIETLINKIPGVEIDISSGLESAYTGIGSKIQGLKDEKQWQDVVGKLDVWDADSKIQSIQAESQWDDTIGKLDRWSYKDAYSSGYSMGEGLANRVSGLFSGSEIAFPTELPKGLGIDNDLMEESLSNIDSNTSKMADNMEISEEDLKYLRDIAERDVINRFTTAEITIEQTNNNQINSQLDLDGIMDKWNNSFTEVLEVAAEGVH
ncbi:hypothetical protein FACS1894198_3800 [Clostridia bacterium]|nr:hypothetical protein FACS1894198_3800 [Clostridia bacterium]